MSKLFNIRDNINTHISKLSIPNLDMETRLLYTVREKFSFDAQRHKIAEAVWNIKNAIRSILKQQKTLPMFKPRHIQRSLIKLKLSAPLDINSQRFIYTKRYDLYNEQVRYIIAIRETRLQVCKLSLV